MQQEFHKVDGLVTIHEVLYEVQTQRRCHPFLLFMVYPMLILVCSLPLICQITGRQKTRAIMFGITFLLIILRGYKDDRCILLQFLGIWSYTPYSY